jgi:hypothetical protein
MSTSESGEAGWPGLTAREGRLTPPLALGGSLAGRLSGSDGTSKNILPLGLGGEGLVVEGLVV